MGTWFWPNIQLAALFCLAVAGIRTWLVIKHPDNGPSTGWGGGWGCQRRALAPDGGPNRGWVLGLAKRPARLTSDAPLALPTPPSQPHIDLQSSPFPNLIPCPECELPAEVTDCFLLRSTDGPVDHVALGCIDGHHFRMALDRLPANVIAQLRADQGVNSPARARVLPREPGSGG